MFKNVLLLIIGFLFCAKTIAIDKRFLVVMVDTNKEKLELFLNDDTGKPFKRLSQLATWLKKQNRDLRLAVNAGMFHKDFSPVGLLVINGKQVSPLNLENGRGNFFLKPNGVFMISGSGPKVIESSEYPAVSSGVRIATQSGPLLLRDGKIHSGFSATATSRLLRNGVGVSGQKVFLVISEVPVTFYELAVFFRDDLHCPDALFLDGVVSSLYSPDMGRNDSRADLGPMLGIIRPN